MEIQASKHSLTDVRNVHNSSVYNILFLNCTISYLLYYLLGKNSFLRCQGSSGVIWQWRQFMCVHVCVVGGGSSFMYLWWESETGLFLYVYIRRDKYFFICICTMRETSRSIPAIIMFWSICLIIVVNELEGIMM